MTMDIIDVLREERNLLIEMLETLKTEKELLIKDDIKELEKVLKAKEELKSRIGEVEKTRIDLCGCYKLKEMFFNIKETDRQEAEEIGKDMENIILGIHETNETNRLLIKQSLNYIRSIINAISPRKPMVYRPTGKMEDGSKVSSILNKSV